MKYAALFSGGKDSSLALWKAYRLGLDIRYLVTVYPEEKYSYMFHRPNLHVVPDLADSLGMELVKIETPGEKEKELDDLKSGLGSLDVEGVITGAVASTYQMSRIEHMANELSLDLFAPLWNMDENELMSELLDNSFKIFIVSVSARGLDERWLGRKLNERTLEELKKLEKKYCINLSGEGGEYESVVLGGPMFHKEFKIGEIEKRWDGSRGELILKKIEVV